MNNIQTDIDELMDIKNKISWNRENEKIMVEWCDIAQCYKWMHARAHQKFSLYNMLFTIPTITLSTISGTASFATGNLKGTEGYYAPMVIGAVNIFVGILSTIQQYLKIAEINEAHRVAAISWDKFARNIKIEITKPPIERTDAGIFFKNSRNEYDRLMETGPTIPDYVIRDFLKEVGGKEGTEQRKLFNELNKPDICNTIVSCRSQLYREDEDKIPPPSMLINPDSQLYPQKTIKKRLSDIMKGVKYAKIEDFIVKFKEHYGREPMPEEIEQYLHNSSIIQIIPEFLKNRFEIYQHKTSIDSGSVSSATSVHAQQHNHMVVGGGGNIEGKNNVVAGNISSVGNSGSSSGDNGGSSSSGDNGGSSSGDNGGSDTSSNRCSGSDNGDIINTLNSPFLKTTKSKTKSHTQSTHEYSDNV